MKKKIYQFLRGRYLIRLLKYDTANSVRLMIRRRPKIWQPVAYRQYKKEISNTNIYVQLGRAAQIAAVREGPK